MNYLTILPVELVQIIFNMSNNPFTNIVLNEMLDEVGSPETTIDERSLIRYTCYHDNIDMFKIVKKRNPRITREPFFNTSIVSSFSLNILDYCMANKFLMEPKQNRIKHIEDHRACYFEATRCVWNNINNSNVRLSREDRKKSEHYYQVWEGIINRTRIGCNKPLKRYDIILFKMESFYLDFIESFYYSERFGFDDLLF